MTYSHKLKYAGADPYRPEQDRLPRQIFEALSTGDNKYDELAQVRWLVDELQNELAGIDNVPESVQTAVFRAADDSEGSLRTAVDDFVAAWLAGHTTWLVEEWGVDEDAVATACEEYDVDVDNDADTIVNDRGEEKPRRSEPADFGHGDSTGVQDL